MARNISYTLIVPPFLEKVCLTGLYFGLRLVGNEILKLLKSTQSWEVQAVLMAVIDQLIIIDGK